MIYKTLCGEKVSQLGMGTMRLPVINGDNNNIDAEQTDRMVDKAMEAGVNYYDVAWAYHGGACEGVIGASLARYPREKWLIADKFPGYDLNNIDKVKEIFPEQLKRTGAGFFDFYLFHNVCELNINQYLDDEKYGIYSYLMEQKRAGKIRHLGFSAHGSVEVMRRFLEAYGRDMEFCQLQINWIDWEFQSAREKCELLKEYGLPVIVMEPLRGGRLSKLSADEEKAISGVSGKTSTEKAFRFLQSLEGVKVILSGMSDFEQMQDNLKTFETDAPLTKEEVGTLVETARSMTKGVPCTGCRYCAEHCPMGIDIPTMLSLYNEHKFTNGGFLAPFVLAATDKDKQPSSCIGCRSCEAVCPQGIKVSEELINFTELLANTPEF